MILEENLRQKLDEVVRRRNFAEKIQAVTHGLFSGGIAYALCRLVIGLFTGGQGALIAAGAGTVAAIAAAFITRRVRHTRLTAARFVDSTLGLQDCLATAVEQTQPGVAKSRVAVWLLKDAAKKATRIIPNELVPYTLPRQARWLPLLAITCIAFSLPIYPQGLLWQFENSTTQKANQRAQELLALADQLDEMPDIQLQQVAHDLRQAAQNLKNKQIPPEQTKHLLQEIEKEFQHPTTNPNANTSTNTNTNASGIDLAQLQALAQRLRAVQNSQLPPGQDQSSTTLADASKSVSHSNSGNYDKNSSVGTDSTTDSDTADSASPTEPQTSQQSKPGSEAYDDAMANDNQEYGSQAGYGPGGTDTQPYQRKYTPSGSSTPISGELTNTGQSYIAGKVGSSAPKESWSGAFGTSTTIFATGLEGVVTQESIPLAYKRWVKLYFEALTLVP